MNVSSVKNLNGQSFSAVQDADLTTVVQANSASWGAGSSPTYDYTDGLISAIDTSGLFAQGLLSGSKIGRNISWYGGAGVLDSAQMWLNPDQTNFAITSGIFSPLTYATGATIAYGSSGSPAPNNGQIFGGFFKGNEWYVSNATAGQALRGETHQSRGVHISGATTAGYRFDLSINAVSGKNDTANGYNWKLERGCVSGKSSVGEWRYGPAEDTLLRSISSNEVNTYVQNNSATIDEVNSTVQSNSGTWGQGGSNDAFYIYPGTTTNKEVADNSGKDMYLYHSGTNTYLKYAGKLTYPNYAIFNFKTITGTQYNSNILANARVNIYPNSTSACKINTIQSIALLDTNSTVNYANTANTAYMDGNGNSLSNTYDTVTALSSFVENNSANWGGGSSPTGGGSVLFHLNANSDPNYGSYYNSYVSGATELYFEASMESQQGTPSEVIITRYGSEIGRVYWSQVSSDGITNYFTASYNNPDSGELGLQNKGNGYQCYVSANGIKTYAFEQRQFYCSTSDTLKFNVQGSNTTGTIMGFQQGHYTPLTSFTGSLIDFTAKGYERYNADIGREYYDQVSYYDVSAELAGGGSTVASSDVFPPTNNLDPYATYYLGWNAKNGGLQWFYQGGNGN